MSKQPTTKPRTATATAKPSKTTQSKTNTKNARPTIDTSGSEDDDDLAIEDSIDVEPARPAKGAKQVKKPVGKVVDDGDALTPREKRLQAKLDIVSNPFRKHKLRSTDKLTRSTRSHRPTQH